MADIILSIRKRWTLQILDGSKTLELRKRIPKPEKFKPGTDRIFLYETKANKGAGAIVSVTDCPGTIKEKVDWLRNWYYGEMGDITDREYYGYFNRMDIAYGYKLANVFEFNTPIKITNPPQDYRFVSDYDPVCLLLPNNRHRIIKSKS